MKFKKTLAAIAVGAAALLLAPTAASASPAPGWLCSTIDATPVYADDTFTFYLFTLSGGRGFRAHAGSGVDGTWIKFYGHGAERPDRDGWVRAQHIYCP